MNHRDGDNSGEHDPVELVEQSEVGSSLESKMLKPEEGFSLNFKLKLT